MDERTRQQKRTAPCKGCIERYTACHDSCERYQLFRAEREEIYRRRAREGAVIEGIMEIKRVKRRER